MNPSRRRVRLPAGWRADALVFAAALAPRLLHLMSLRSLPTFEGLIMDEAYHAAWARSIASGDWLGSEVFFRAPLYPYFLGAVYAVAGTGGLAPRLVQCVLGSISVVILHRIARRLCAPGPALAAALLCALAWPLIHEDNELMLPVLEVLLSLASVAMLLRAGGPGARRRAWTLAGGFALGLAAITRPNMLAFAPLAAAWIAWPRGAPGARPGWWPAGAAWLMCAVMLPILPVTARNAVVGGDAVLIASQGGVNFYIGNNPLADGTTAVVPGTRPTWQGGYEDTLAIARRDTGRGDLKPSEISRYWFRRGLAFWRDEPARAARLLLRKAGLFFSGTEISNNKDLTFFRGLSPVLSLPLPGAWLLVPLGVAGWALAFAGASRDRRLALALPLAFGVSYAASVIAFFVTTRFRAPVLPILALGCGMLADRMLAWWREGRRRPAMAAAAASGALLVAMNLDVWGYRDDPAQGHMALAQGWEASGRLSEAAGEYGRAAEMGGPYRYEALARRGIALATLGRAGEAASVLREALTERPDNLDAAVSLLDVAAASGGYAAAREFVLATAEGDAGLRGALLFTVGSMDQRLGRDTEAEAAYREALALDPSHLGAALNLALLLRLQGRLDESLDFLARAERIDPADPSVQVQLAKHHLALGDRPRALEHAARAEAAGGVLDPAFREALGPR
jgi:tetratricopeptide (TPR) repeat protein